MSETAEQSAARRLQQVDERWDEARSERALGSLERRIRRRRVTRVSLAVCAAAGLVAALAFPGHDRARRLTKAVDVAPAPAAIATPLPMHLGDGSTIRPATGAEVVVREVSAERVRIGLAHGRAGFEVSHRPEREFIVDTGAVRVLVVGTRFTVEPVGDRTHVAVEEGHVRVQWGDDVPVTRDLRAGEQGTYPSEDDKAEDDAPREATAPAAPPPEARPPVKPSHAPGGEWRRLARQGGYREAYDLIVAAGPSGVRDDVNDLLLAADAARLSDDPKRALGYLDRVIDGHARDDRAPMAAFTRGRIYVGLERPAEAAESFDRAIVLGAQGSLHENALARAVEAYARAGNRARAQALARAYLSRYPEGRWLPMIRANIDPAEPPRK